METKLGDKFESRKSEYFENCVTGRRKYSQDNAAKCRTPCYSVHVRK